MIRAGSVNIPQTISGGVGGPSGEGQGGGGGTGEGPRMNYYINTQHFTMPVHFLMQDSRVGLSGINSEGPSSVASAPSSVRRFAFTPQFSFCGRRKCCREEMSDELPTQKEDIRRQMGEEDEFKIIRRTDLELIREIGSGPGYLLHAGRNRSRAVIVKVFHRGPTVRQQLESTVALSKDLMHPNVLRIKGISCPHSLSGFIVYDIGHCVNAEILLAAALKKDLARSIALGFTMVAEVSAGISHLCMQGVWPRSMGVANFHILVDLKDRFLILINAPQRQVVRTAAPQEPEDNAVIVFNALLDETLMSANRILHKEKIKRDPAIPDPKRPSFAAENSAATSVSSTPNIEGDELVVPPRREYVWRTMNRGQQALAEVSEGLIVDLKLHLSRLSRLTETDGQSAHRCPGYVREEITLATTILESAVVAHDTPSPLEECPVCHEVVGLHEKFHCICGDLTPGSRHTIKCRECKVWSHSDCVGNPREFTCGLCRPEMAHSRTTPRGGGFFRTYQQQEPGSPRNASGALTPNFNYAEIGQGRGVVQQNQTQTHMERERHVPRRGEGMVPHHRLPFIEVDSSRSLASASSSTSANRTATRVQTAQTTAASVVWPYREPASPTSPTTRELQESVVSALGGGGGGGGAGESRGRSVKRSLRNTLNAAEHYASSLIFGKVPHHHPPFIEVDSSGSLASASSSTSANRTVRVQTAQTTAASVMWPYREPVSPTSLATRELREWVASAPAEREVEVPYREPASPTSPTRAGELRGQSVKRSLRNTLNAAEHYTSALIFGHRSPPCQGGGGAGETELEAQPAQHANEAEHYVSALIFGRPSPPVPDDGR